MNTAYRIREGNLGVGSADESLVAAETLVSPQLSGLSKQPYSQENRLTRSDWENFAPEHLDVDRPGDKETRVSA